MAWSEQLPSGAFRGVYRTPDGKRRSAGTFPNRRAAERAAAAAEGDMQRAGYRSPDRGHITITEWKARWWRTRRVDAGTLRKDDGRWRNHIEATWGSVYLDEVTRFDVKDWVSDLAKAGLAPATIERCVALLSSAFRGAIDAELIDANPAGRLRLPKPDNARERYLTRDEGSAILAALSGRDRAMVAFMLGVGGARWGEMAGADIADYDASAGTYRVRQVWDTAEATLKPYPKGKRRRTVPVPDWVSRELRPLVGTRRRGLIFRSSTHTPMNLPNWRSRVLQPVLEDLGIDGVTPHTFRHTYASWLIQEGVSLAEVGRLMGHTTPLTTQRYAHLLDETPESVRHALRDPRTARSPRRAS